jgi:hypothetical protein
LDAATSTQEEDNKKQQSIPNDYKVWILFVTTLFLTVTN